MDRIGVTVFFCVALVVGIIWQAPPQVYRNVSAYYESLTKGRGPAKGTNNGQAPSRKGQNRKPSSKVDDMRTASFNPLDSASEDRAERAPGVEAAPETSANKAGRPATSVRKPNGKQNPEAVDSKRN